MGVSTYFLYGLTIILLVISFKKDINKTKLAIKKGLISFKKLIPVLVPLFMFVGIILTIITPGQIQKFIGDESGILGVTAALVVGSISFMPPFVTYPLGVELLESGAGYPQVAALVTTLMTVGFVYISAEAKFFTKKSVFYRNSLALVASAIVAFVIWLVM